MQRVHTRAPTNLETVREPYQPQRATTYYSEVDEADVDVPVAKDSRKSRKSRKSGSRTNVSYGQPHAPTYSDLGQIEYGNAPLDFRNVRRREAQVVATDSESDKEFSPNPHRKTWRRRRPQRATKNAEPEEEVPSRPVSARRPKSKFLSDLVRDSKIETTIENDCTRHISYVSGRSARERRMRIEELWMRETRLGQGAFGTVYRERCRQDEDGPLSSRVYKLRAVKEIKKYVVEGEDLAYTRELEAVMKFSNPRYSHCFVRSDGWYEHGDSIFIAMEYLELGDLQRHLTRPLPETQARDIVGQVLEGLRYMHENSFVHRDLKPGNIMVVATAPDWFVKLADFGISKRRHQDVTSINTMQRGTIGYAAPEAIGDFGVDQGEKTESSAYAVDIWSLGAVMYRILTNTSCFQNLGQLALYATKTGNFPIRTLEERKVSDLGKEFLVSLMNPTPEERPSAVSAMAHPWMKTPLDAVTDQVSQTNLGDAGPNTGISAPSAAWSDEDPTVQLPEKAASVGNSREYHKPSVESCSDESDLDHQRSPSPILNEVPADAAIHENVHIPNSRASPPPTNEGGNSDNDDDASISSGYFENDNDDASISSGYFATYDEEADDAYIPRGRDREPSAPRRPQNPRPQNPVPEALDANAGYPRIVVREPSPRPRRQWSSAADRAGPGAQSASRGPPPAPRPQPVNIHIGKDGWSPNEGRRRPGNVEFDNVSPRAGSPETQQLPLTAESLRLYSKFSLGNSEWVSETSHRVGHKATIGGSSQDPKDWARNEQNLDNVPDNTVPRVRGNAWNPGQTTGWEPPVDPLEAWAEEQRKRKGTFRRSKRHHDKRQRDGYDAVRVPLYL